MGNVLLGLSQANGTTHSISPTASKTSFSRSWIAGTLIVTMSTLSNATYTYKKLLEFS